MQVLSIENVMELSAVPKQHDVRFRERVKYICSETNCEKDRFAARRVWSETVSPMLT
jgi:hypothetical protein